MPRPYALTTKRAATWHHKRVLLHPELNDAKWLRFQHIEQGTPMHMIARQLGVDSRVVSRTMHYFGIPIRKNRFPVYPKTKPRAWNSWSSIHKRCDHVNNRVYDRYGGRGITLCQGWRGPAGFFNFLTDMGERPEGLSLDRIDNDGGYWCGHCEECQTNGWKANCRWTDWVTQNNNRRVAKTATPKNCPHCNQDIAGRVFWRHIGTCERNTAIAQRFLKNGSRRTVAAEFGVSEQVVKRSVMRYRALQKNNNR